MATVKETIKKKETPETLLNIHVRHNFKGGIGEFTARSDTWKDRVCDSMKLFPDLAQLQNLNISSSTRERNPFESVG